MKTLIFKAIAALFQATSKIAITDRTAKKLDFIVPLGFSTAAVVCMTGTIIAKYGFECGAVPAIVTDLFLLVLIIFLWLITA